MTRPLATLLVRVKEAAIQARKTVNWAALKAEAKRAFLKIDEDEALREAVDEMVQSKHEKTQAYVHCFKEGLLLAL